MGLFGRAMIAVLLGLMCMLASASIQRIPAGVPTAGLDSYYSFDDGTARDDSGNGNDGQLQGAATIVLGMIGDAVSLDGISSSVNVRNASALNTGSQVTISFWMKADPGNAMDKCCQGLVTTDYYGIEISGGRDPRVGVNFFTNTGGSFYQTSDAVGGGSPVSPGQWHYVVGVYDGSTMRLYIDGSLVAQRPQSGSISPMLGGSFLAIGSEDGRTSAPSLIGARYFRGLIDEVAIYNRALSDDEVLSIFKATAMRSSSMPPSMPTGAVPTKVGGGGLGGTASAGNAFSENITTNPGINNSSMEESNAVLNRAANAIESQDKKGFVDTISNETLNKVSGDPDLSTPEAAKMAKGLREAKVVEQRDDMIVYEMTIDGTAYSFYTVKDKEGGQWKISGL
ncbi:Concanavalin A-like lectin/glucanases superfamily protein [uncultured archaeon]|nr:Concanavalin A-like lectin/glucanases superfamily protein [uncultured archaeon]